MNLQSIAVISFVFFLQRCAASVLTEHDVSHDFSSKLRVFSDENGLPSLTSKHSALLFRQYTGEQCQTNADCAAPRICINLVASKCGPNDEICICYSESSSICTTSTDCLPNDRCITSGSVNICLSCNTDLDEGNYTPIDEGNCSSNGPKRSPSSKPPTPTEEPPPTDVDGTGYTGELCRTSSECATPRRCYTSDGDKCSSSDSDCFCADTDNISCSTSSNCLPFDRCYILSGVGICISCNFGEDTFEGTPTDEGNCATDGTLPSSSPTSTPPPAATDGPSGRKLGTGEQCTKNSQCDPPRKCYTFDDDLCTALNVLCVCESLSHLICDTSADCLSGDRCYIINGDSVCLSCYIKPDDFSGTPIDGGNCQGTDPTATSTPESTIMDPVTTSASSPSPIVLVPSASSSISDPSSPSPFRTSKPASTPSSTSSASIFIPITSSTPSATVSTGRRKKPSSSPSSSFAESPPSTETPTQRVDPSLSSSPSMSGLVGGIVTPSVSVSPSMTDNPVVSMSPTASMSTLADTLPNISPSPINTVSPIVSTGPSYTVSPTIGNSPNSSTSTSATDPDSPTFSDSPDASPTEENVCISADALLHLDESSLVFKKHRRGAVLCDTHENCATPGHIVLYRGEAMPMSRYCALNDISCVRRVTLVNSPRMKIGLRIASRSRDLKFTALAAARETWVERFFLKLLVSLGV